MYSSIKGFNYLGDHFAPILLVFVPFYFVGFGNWFLTLTYVVSISLGALPIYWLAKDNLKNEKFHLLFPVAYLLYLPLWHIIQLDMHPAGLAISLFLFAFYFLSKEKYTQFLIFLITAMLCKENMPLVGAFFGLYILFFKKKKLLGSILALFGIFLFFFELQYLIPLLRGPEGYSYFSRYDYLGSHMSEMIKTILFNPIYVLRHIFITDKIIYVVLLLAGVSFLPLFSPSTLLLSIPVFAQNIFSSSPNQYSFHNQYNSGIIPFLFISAIFGLKNLLKNKNDDSRKKISKYVSRVMIFFMVISILEFSLGFLLRYACPTKHVFYGHSLLKKIPKNASVSASNQIHPHLTHRKEIWDFPKGVGQAEYVIIETFDPTWPIEEKDYPKVIEKLWKQKRYKKLFGFFFLGEIGTPYESKASYQKEVDALLQNKDYETLVNQNQFLLLKKVE